MLGLLCASAWFTTKDALPTALPLLNLNGQATTSTSTTRPQDSGAVAVVAQPAGSTVTLESLTVPPPGVWVAVRETQGNDLGNVLGALRVTGPRSGVSIPLLRATLPGLQYAIELYRDDGNETFDLATESVYVDFATGLPVIATFTATN